MSLARNVPDFELIQLGRLLYVCPILWECIVVGHNVHDFKLIGFGRIIYVGSNPWEFIVVDQ